MPLTEVWGIAERDRVTLRQVIELRLTLVFECRNCKHVSQFDVLGLVERFGADAPLGAIRRRGKCRLCKHRHAELLMKLPGPRSREKWWPHAPGRWNEKR
jgi:hypothetical protein